MKLSHTVTSLTLSLMVLLPLEASSKLLNVDKRCVGKEDMQNLEIALKNLSQVAQSGDAKAMAQYMHFPITDNHNHAITQRVFIEEETYGPVISVKKLFKEALPASLDAKNIKHHPYLDYCNMYTIENSLGDNSNGVRFVFKKIGKFFQLKLIRFGSAD